ncbi:MAG: hypothetical protein WBQ53_11325 [Methylocystis sp.]
MSLVHWSAQACICSREAAGNLGGGAEVSGGGGVGKGAFGAASGTRAASFFGSRGAAWEGAACGCGFRSAGAGAFSFFFTSSRRFPGAVFPAVGFAYVFSAVVVVSASAIGQ